MVIVVLQYIKLVDFNKNGSGSLAILAHQRLGFTPNFTLFVLLDTAKIEAKKMAVLTALC
jgi:hypothetical protein